MNATSIDPIETDPRRVGAEPPRRRHLTRTLLVAAIACFALPFLTVTCYGPEGVTVSGIQAATTIDLDPSDPTSEAQLTREEPPNAFALVALAAAAIGLALTFGRKLSREAVVWFAAGGAIALEGFFLYALYRSTMEVAPRFGLAGAMALLVAVAWAGVGAVPRWVAAAGAVIALALLGAAFVPAESFSTAWPFLIFYAGGVASVALAVGAIRASSSIPSGSAAAPASPGIKRMLLAGLASIGCLAVAGVGAPWLVAAAISGEEPPPSVGTSGAFAVVVLAVFFGTSVAAWAAGHAIARGRRRTRGVAVAYSM